MAPQTFVNLPVKDLAKATEFFTKLGFSFDQQSTDESATRIIVSDDLCHASRGAVLQGLHRPQDVADTSNSKEVIVGLSADSWKQVDDFTDKAFAAGDRAGGEPQDDGFLYMRAFSDLDGYQLGFIYMDMSAIAEG